jgi:lipopolysaccharide/colanic/teichoic acid biosynthesis glycosyltransferase
MLAKRIFDICLSAVGVVLLTPVFILLSLLIMADSKGPVVYIQRRVGFKGTDFGLMKFRTMYPAADKLGNLTIGSRDPRITRIGYWLRKYKLDELPQLFNILRGEMSFVGPRPEVRKYVNMYTLEQLQVLKVRPGLTDWASIAYFNESDLLAHSSKPEQLYIEKIIPSKLSINLAYIKQQSLWTDIKVICQTIKRVVNK